MEEKKQGSSLGSVILCFYIWIKSIQITTSEKKRSIQMTGVHKEAMAVSAMPKEIIQEEFLIRLHVKTLTRFKFLSKDCKDFISDGYFSGRDRSLEQFNGSTHIGFICSNNTDNYAEKHVFCLANKFLYTSEKHVFGGANKFLYCVSKANKLYYDCIFAYDSDDPNRHVLLIQVPSTWGDSLYGNLKRHFEGMKDGSLQFINIRDMVIEYTRKRSIQMTCVHKEAMAVSNYVDLLPNEIIEEEVLIRLPVKTLMRFKCVSKDWNDFISGDHFCRRYQSLQQISGFFCGNKDDNSPAGSEFCVANKFLCTSENNVEKEELESFEYFKKTFGYVIAASKGLLLVGHNSKSLCVYDLVSKKHVNLPRNNLFPVVNVAYGFKCEESSSSNHFCSYKVLCVDVCYRDYRNNYYSYDLEIYSSESGTWKKGVMKSLLRFCMSSRNQSYKVIGGVFHWLHCWFDFIVAYDSDDPTGRIVLIKLPLTSNGRLQRKISSHYEGTKDGSLQYITIKDMAINVWILNKKSTSGQRSINYMDEDVVYKDEWSLGSSVSIFDIGVHVGQKQQRIIGADPADARIIYLEVSNKLYAYNHCERKGRFINIGNIMLEKELFFIHFEWPTWPCL